MIPMKHALTLLATNPHFPALRSGPMAVSGASRQKQIPGNNKITMFAYANPRAFPAPLTNLAASAGGHGLVRFDKGTRKITMECWPRGVEVTQPDAKQHPGCPITINQLDNYGRNTVAWLPEVEAPPGIATPVVRVVEERSGEVIYTLRAKTPRFQPWVFAEGSSTVRIGEPPSRVLTLTGQRSRQP